MITLLAWVAWLVMAHGVRQMGGGSHPAAELDLYKLGRPNFSVTFWTEPNVKDLWQGPNVSVDIAYGPNIKDQIARTFWCRLNVSVGVLDRTKYPARHPTSPIGLTVCVISNPFDCLPYLILRLTKI